ncbi:DUF302 domain-containing protein [Yoonia sediminilitoris]|uniref:Uncharacterized protein (DUF302 family) n=1 Tax=Yoonia sediminilitoris TaxID=1286148 RepID=A0A2T6KJV5_9RHOB|nr:DUF302 domain-containing protein [Yoonia sediminilitoris]PUB16247.1 uncharacterized protein (DUF302 family) [Yoonia sediminilitoris]RCW96596.1 uncharacterized protein (DUF302 family) [Yoonia sediminilitoris]
MRFFILVLILLTGPPALADSVQPRDGWVVEPTDKPFDALLGDLRAAVRENGMAVVTQAGPTGAAAQRGIIIPQNRVVGVFNNVFAVRILDASVSAMIEAPVRFYLTEENDGVATLSYKKPTFVFAPYALDAGPDLMLAASELDAVFAAIAADAIQ